MKTAYKITWNGLDECIVYGSKALIDSLKNCDYCCVKIQSQFSSDTYKALVALNPLYENAYDLLVMYLTFANATGEWPK